MGLESASCLCVVFFVNSGLRQADSLSWQMSMNQIHKADNGRSQAARSVAMWFRLLVVAAKPKIRYRFWALTQMCYVLQKQNRNKVCMFFDYL
jgi:hypothetical protein